VYGRLRQNHAGRFQPLSSFELSGKARQRQVQAGELFGKGKDSISSNELNLSEGQARDQAARAVGLSPRTDDCTRTRIAEQSKGYS